MRNQFSPLPLRLILPRLILPRLTLSCVVLAASACDKSPAPARTPPPAASTPELPAAPTATVLAEETTPTLALGPTATQLDTLERPLWNRLAAEQDIPLFWRGDENSNKSPDLAELAVLWPADASEWKTASRLGEVQGLLLRRQKDAPTPDTDEGKRQAAVLAELRQGRPTLLYADLQARTPAEKALVTHVLAAARHVEALFALQGGTAELAEHLPTHRPSHALFHRNQGPWCEAPKTERDANCSALADKPAKRTGMYPLSIQRDREFCAHLAEGKAAAELLGPFTVVQEDAAGQAIAVPYEKAWPKQMGAVATELDAAAAAMADVADEKPLVVYLKAAARAFRDGSWFAADEAWAAMEGKSKWYLRIGPDETYHEPCARKAGFHVSFALVNQKAVAWQNLLEPLKTQLEGAIAKLAGPPYKSGKVNFHLPAFIDVLVNAGDSRSALGATVGQSLPNWGPVANESRGRTVAMANLYTDLDSQAAMRTQVRSLFCKDSASLVPTDPESLMMTTVLHEAGHNLGPAHEYKVKGKVDDDVFGGPLAATLEELKAETIALYLADWLVDAGKLEPAKRSAGQAAGVAWAMGHIAQGMWTPSHKPKPYSQLSAVQVGALYDAKALTWHTDQVADNGEDKGCFSLHPDRMAKAVLVLMGNVAQIKAQGDKARAEALITPYVADDSGEFAKLRATIAERWLRVPKAAFVYAVRLD